MTLESGTKLGAYEILSPIGAGGMGEVYKATDTRLDRTVAIKVLPAHLTGNAELRQRFEQEARAVSSLNHAHICTLYDVHLREPDGPEDIDIDIDYIVMEYVEGETLAERLVRGPLPWVEAVDIATALADALDCAHRAGVVHRDVKPANLILTKSGPKLLDFGLAKTRHGGAADPDSSAATEAKPLTEKGAILGTFQYMAPEQLEGREVDARSDIFALGVVIYEMVTGEKAFSAETQARLIAAIMSETPRAVSETVLAPASLDRVVGACLEKDPDRRWQSAFDLKRNLEWVVDPAGETVATPASPAPGRGRVVAGVGGALAGIAVTAALLASFTRTDRPSSQYFQIDLGEHEGMEPGVRTHVAVSPDGSLLAHTAVRGGTSRLYLRRLDELEAHVVPESEGANRPFFSPDGEWVGFKTHPQDRALKKVSIHGGAPQRIADATVPGGSTWLTDHTIITSDWSDTGGSLFRVTASGSSTELMIAPDPNRGEVAYQSPQVLPDGDSILFTMVRRDRSEARVLSLNTGIHRTLIENAVLSRYVPSGHLLFVRGGALWAVGFNLSRLEIVGAERPLISGVEQRGGAAYAFSATGLLAYMPGEEGPWIDEALSWVERSGERTPATADRHDYQSPRISPAGDKVAVNTSAIFDSGSDIWILSLPSRRLERITFRDGQDFAPVWTSDGRSLIFASDRGESSVDLYRQSVDPSGDAELLLASEHDLVPLDVSPDGRFLAFRQTGDIYLLSLEDQSISPFIETPFLERHATFSPDGRFLAYSSDESGRPEVYVQPFPPTGGKTQISRGGTDDAVWAGDGSEIYYLRGRTLAAVKVQLSPRFAVIEERELFEAPINRGRNFDVHPTSGRFLFVDKTIDSPPRFVNVVTNFFDLLESDAAR